MNTVSVHLEFPSDLLGALDVPEAALGKRLHEVLAVGLFREGNVSSGKAAELLGVAKDEFVTILARHGVAYFSETPGEVGHQVEVAEDVLRRARL